MLRADISYFIWGLHKCLGYWGTFEYSFSFEYHWFDLVMPVLWSYPNTI